MASRKAELDKIQQPDFSSKFDHFVDLNKLITLSGRSGLYEGQKFITLTLTLYPYL